MNLLAKVDWYMLKINGRMLYQVGNNNMSQLLPCISHESKVMLFDEPTSALDPELVNDVLKVIKELLDEGMTMVIVTHECVLPKKFPIKLLFIHEASLQNKVRLKIYLITPKTEELQRFLNVINEK